MTNSHRLHLAALALTAVLPAQAPTPLATFAVHGVRHWISSEERFVLLEGAEGVQLLDVTAAALVPLPSPGRWQAGAFDAVGRRLWLVEETGTARAFGLPTAPAGQWTALDRENVVDIGVPKLDDDGRAPRFHDLVLAADGAHLAWSLAAGGERIAGVHAIATGAEVVRFENVDSAAMSADDQPWIAFVGAGAHVVVQHRQERGEVGHGGSRLVVHELGTGRQVARFSPCAAARTAGRALLPDGLVVGTRSGTRDWPVVRWRIGAAVPVATAWNARGGHFTDLYGEPGGRVVCEWDFEDRDGILVHDVVAQRPPIRIAPGDAFVGFASPAQGRDVGGVLARGADGVLRRYAWDTGELQGEFAMGAACQVGAAHWSGITQRILTIGRVDPSGRGPPWEARVWTAPADLR